MASTSSNPLELTLRLKVSCVPKSLTNFFSDLANVDNVPDKLSALNDYLQKHEEELRRVEEFERYQLPQCRLLLLDAIEILNAKILKLISAQACKNRTCDDQVERRSAFRKYQSSSPPFNPKPRNKDQTNHDHQITKKVKGKEMAHEEPSPRTPFPCDLIMEADDSELESEPEPQSPQPLQRQPLLPLWKNSRRSWTPELHATFVEALSLLGGPEVATPKQIREVMQVEGLTNDQVKSHLQKYRLSCREVHPAATANSRYQTRTTPFYYRDFWNPTNSSDQ